MMFSTWKKISFLILTAGIFTTTVNAQIQFGIKGGFNIAELSTSSNQSVVVNNEHMGIRNFPRTDFHGGFLLSVPLFKKFSFQPEVVYSQQGATGNPSGGALVSAKVDEQLVGGVNTGKYYHVKDQYKSTDIGWVLGVGYLSPIDLGFDIRYNLSLSSINNASASDMQSAPVQGGSIKNSVVQIGVFYLFGKSKNKTAFKAAEGS